MKLQRQILSALFLALYVVAILRPFSPYVNYYLNKEQITEEKCVNKDKPKLECDGKCYLKKQVISMQKEDDNSPGVLDLKVEKYVHDGVERNDENLLSWGVEKEKMLPIVGFNVLHMYMSVPVPPPRIQS